jgi:hypothetical protein
VGETILFNWLIVLSFSSNWALRKRQLLPAAAWYFMFMVCSFFALRGEKRTQEG